MKSKKIVWDDNVANPKNLKIFCLSVDGTDYKVNEHKHKTLPRDNGACSHKMKHAAAKYEIAMSVHHPKCVHIAGPFKGGTHDLEMFRQGGLKEKLQALNVKLRNVRHTKVAIVDQESRREEPAFDNQLNKIQRARKIQGSRPVSSRNFQWTSGVLWKFVGANVPTWLRQAQVCI